MTMLYLLLGGNLGDKKKIFTEARELLGQRIGKMISFSSVYETEPWGFQANELFWNQVLKIETELSPEDVLRKIQQIEQDLGRIRKENRYDSRIIDIDILFYSDQIIEQEDLIVPHPRIQERKFTLVPLNEIAPDLVHPVFKKSIRHLLEECTDLLNVIKVPDLNF